MHKRQPAQGMHVWLPATEPMHVEEEEQERLQCQSGWVLHLHRRQHKADNAQFDHWLLIILNLTIIMCFYSCCALQSIRTPCLICGGRSGSQQGRLNRRGSRRRLWIFSREGRPWSPLASYLIRLTTTAIFAFSSTISWLVFAPSLISFPS